MDEGMLKRLIRMVEESDIEELEVDRPFAGRVRIVRRRSREAPPALAPPAVSVAVATPPPPAPLEAPAPSVAPAAPTRDPGLVAIVAPMVGTYYAAPAPGAKPYLSVGDTVSVGQVVCIVEAMKLMNEVQSEVSGRVLEVKVENGQAVEYGQELFLVGPA
ncbi:MAG: acetyl-CoA carboxylase biotin carboxyl carrier protein [bacterium]